MSVPFIAYARRDKLSITGYWRGRGKEEDSKVGKTEETDRREDDGWNKDRRVSFRRGFGGGGGRYWIIGHCPLARGERRGSWLEYENNISFLALGMIDVYSTLFGGRSSLCRVRFQDSDGIVPRFLPRKLFNDDDVARHLSRYLARTRSQLFPNFWISRGIEVWNIVWIYLSHESFFPFLRLEQDEADFSISSLDGSFVWRKNRESWIFRFDLQLVDKEENLNFDLEHLLVFSIFSTRKKIMGKNYEPCRIYESLLNGFQRKTSERGRRESSLLFVKSL